MKFVNFLKSRLIFNKFHCFSHISRAHIVKSKRCSKVKSSTYYFHKNTKIWADFQVCIRAPLKKKHFVNFCVTLGSHSSEHFLDVFVKILFMVCDTC